MVSETKGLGGRKKNGEEGRSIHSIDIVLEKKVRSSINIRTNILFLLTFDGTNRKGVKRGGVHVDIDENPIEATIEDVIVSDFPIEIHKNNRKTDRDGDIGRNGGVCP